MAEAALSFAVGKIGGFLFQEGIFLYGVRDQLEWVKTELRRIQCFLKDADAKRRKGDERMKNWVREVTEVAYQVEDVIDNFMLQVEPRRQHQQQSRICSIEWYTLIFSELKARYNVGKEIEKIKIKVREISESRVTYGIANLDEIGGDVDESLELRRRVSPSLSDGTDVIVGFNVYCEEVVSQLLATDIRRRCVISIVGMGGLGKTTLAKKIFNSREITDRFSTCVWVTVSQDYRLAEILKAISKKAMGTSEEDIEEVKEKLHAFLQERTYLIVMDDIWSVNVWRQINEVLPEAMNGSRVLFTTRNEDVARSADPGISPFKLPLLDDNGSWELFIKKVFQTSPCPGELREVAEKMAKKCGGLPLALLVLGGLLSRKPATPLVWQKVYENLDWESASDGMECLKILALSYNNLPSHYLKSCFLYMGVFPEDSEIKASKLVNLWIAEGFIQRRGHESLEDTACSYLEELAQRSLIQVVRRSMCHGGISQCRIHDLLRETCLMEAKQAGFLNVICSGNAYEDNNIVAHDFPISRRFALQHLTDGNTPHLPLPQNLRSLFVSSESDYFDGHFLQGMKLLRVLELQPRLDLPKDIGLMTHLRYLEIPECLPGPTTMISIMGKLRCLQTLDLRGTVGLEEFIDIGELPELRHLYFPFIAGVPPPPVTTQTKLQTLKSITRDVQWIKGDLARLTNLRSLSMLRYGPRASIRRYVEDKEGAADFGQTLGSLIHLASFKLTTTGKRVREDKVSVDIIVSLKGNPHFQKLFLDAKILEGKLPDSGVFPPNLVKLTLERSGLKEDPMSVLERLPRLIFLKMDTRAYIGEGMVCTTGGFPQLRTLNLCDLRNLTSWIVEAGAFANLTSWRVEVYERLFMFPKIRHVPAMEKFWGLQIQIYPDGTYGIIET